MDVYIISPAALTAVRGVDEDAWAELWVQSPPLDFEPQALLRVGQGWSRIGLVQAGDRWIVDTAWPGDDATLIIAPEVRCT